MKKIGLFLFLLLGIHLCFVCYFHFGERIRPGQFQHGFKKLYAVEIPGLDYEQLDSILCQPFHQLGRGMQMTAFESADGNYVLKLFHPRAPKNLEWYLKNWKKTYSLKFMSQEWFRTGYRLEKMFRRLQIAFSVLREETGLVFLHLSPSDRVHHSVALIDKKGKSHLINLRETPFVLQKKAVIASAYFDQLAKENRTEELKEALARMEALFIKRLRFAITDQNQNMDINFGFVEGNPIQIDVGSIKVDPVLLLNSEEEEKRIMDRFHNWVGSRFPSI